MLEKNFAENATCDPLKYFEKPEEVVFNNELSRQEKIKILESWRDMCKKMEIAEYEGMKDVTEDLLPLINNKILELTAEIIPTVRH